MRPATIVICVGTALAASACGSAGSSSASRPQAPTAIDLSALVSDSRVAVSPMRIGAGPVVLTVTNQGSRSHAVVVSRAGRSGAVARTAPINPQGATQLSVQLRQGSYTVALVRGGRRRTDAQRSRGVAPATIETVLRVGRARRSGGNALLSP